MATLGVARSNAKGKGQSCFHDWPLFNAGNDLRSHTLSRAVPSALRGLTSVFGMGTGGTPAVRSRTRRVACVASEPRAEILSAFQRRISRHLEAAFSY